jgi:hypothetical protein
MTTVNTASPWQFMESINLELPAKRARLENNNNNNNNNVASRTNTMFFDSTTNHATTLQQQQQNWLRLREMRRASIAQFMDQGSPIKLDTSIDKGIFDCNPLLTDNSSGASHMQLPPPPFKSFDEERPRQQIEDDPVADAVEVSKTLHDALEQPPKKAGTKRKTNSNDVRFRSHQAESWMEKYEELLDYRLKSGDCLVPNQFPQNPSLAEWVKRQRYQYKLKCMGQHSSMSDDRIAALEKLGFVWNSHDAVWEERLVELKQYRSMFGDTNVPSSYESNPKLAIWVKRQRRQYKFLKEGKPSTMTPYRVTRLSEIEFSWSGRKPKKE